MSTGRLRSGLDWVGGVVAMVESVEFNSMILGSIGELPNYCFGPFGLCQGHDIDHWSLRVSQRWFLWDVAQQTHSHESCCGIQPCFVDDDAVRGTGSLSHLVIFFLLVEVHVEYTYVVDLSEQDLLPSKSSSNLSVHVHVRSAMSQMDRTGALESSSMSAASLFLVWHCSSGSWAGGS
jgi:hypothetical protein